MQNNKKGYLFIFLSLAGVSVFLMLPYLDILMKSFSSVSGGEVIGLDNFKQVIQNEAFQVAMKNTGRFIIVCIPLLLLLSLAISIYIYENPRLGNMMKTTFLIPMAIPITSVVLMWRFLFDDKGILNGILCSLGLDTVSWMNGSAAFWILVGSYIWKNLGYNIILWLAALATIDPQVQSAAKLDGASGFQRLVRITLPSVKNGTFIVVVLAILNSFKVFREVYLVAGDYPHESIYMIQHLFNNWFRELELNKLAAGAVIDSAVLIILILILQKCWKKGGTKL
ncbi:MAG: sugar ABC transporter permease [Clostridia bacterium]|nr:sugar ABC transporter permease [Clostridia bacterium]